MEKYGYSDFWINQLESERHWRMYWNQQKLLEGNIDKKDRIGEIGVGTKFTTNYLISKGYNVRTIDIDPGKKPDVLANIVTCEEAILEFDVVLAFNILEHIPYEDMISVIKKFKNAGTQKLFIGLPINQKNIFEMYIKVGRFYEKQLSIRIPRKRITAQYHHWELEYKDFTIARLISDYKEIGYSCKNQTRFKMTKYLYFEI